MPTYTHEEKQFINFWIPRIKFHMAETGILPLEMLANLTAYPDEVRFLERYLILRRTGDVNQFLDNYRRRFYTKQCLAYQTLDQCLTAAVEGGHQEIVELLLQRGDVDVDGALFIAVMKADLGLMDILGPLATENAIEEAMDFVYKYRSTSPVLYDKLDTYLQLYDY